ncbi:MAG: ABC transporter permease, partial [Bacteroidota bacterium]
MLKNYIILTLRKIFRYRTYSLINILGLSIGLASFIIIMLYVYDEYSYDSYHENSDRTFRVTSVMDFNGVGEESSSQPFPMAAALYKEYPEYIENYVRFFNLQKSVFTVAFEEKIFNEKRFFYADTSVFNVFDYRLIKGDKSTVLIKPFTMVITKSIAAKYFGDEDPIGRILKVENSLEFEITGIIEDVPQQSHFKFDFLASFNSLNHLLRNEKILHGWVWNPCWTYLLLKDEQQAEKLAAQFPEFMEKYLKIGKKDSYSLYLQSLTDIHLRSHLDYEIEKNDKEEYVQILLVIAILILVIASINFINLATAGAANRSKEIGIKKIVGATKTQLIIQFLVESLVITFISLLIAISLVELFLPAFGAVSGKVVTEDFRFRVETISGLIGLGVITAIISGIYPALFMSSLKPIRLLQGIIRQGTRSAKFRKALVLVQFSISIMLIIGTIGIFKQLKYLHNADLGFKNKQIIVLSSEYGNLAWKFEKFKNVLLENNIIQNVTGMDYIIGQSHNTHDFIPEGYPKDEYQFYPSLYVRDGFVKTFDIDIIAGRDFLEKEVAAGKEVLVNEEMVKYLNYENNDSILGKTFKTSQGIAKVVGVISNINVTSLHTKVEPFIINMYTFKDARINQTKFIAIQVEEEYVEESLKFIENLWNKYEPDRPFEYIFLKDELDQHYKSEGVLADLAGIFTILSILIASLGIWALTAYITEFRTREIGIRKALGASVYNILKLINIEFIFILIVSNIIAWPIAYYALNIWIDGFAYRTELSIWIFIGAFVISFINAVLTISHKSVSAATK